MVYSLKAFCQYNIVLLVLCGFFWLQILKVQAALDIRRLGIRGLLYLGTRKWERTLNSKGNFINLSPLWWFCCTRIHIFHERNTRE